MDQTIRNEVDCRAPGHLEALYSIASAAGDSQELDVVLSRALEAILALLDMPAGILRRIDPESGALPAAALAGLPAALAGELSRPSRIESAPEGLAARQRSLILIADLAKSPYSESSWARHGYRTFISVPLQCRGMVLGCLNLASPEVRPFRAADRDLLTAAANLIAMAIANAELYAAAQLKVHYLSVLHQCTQDLGPAPGLERILCLATERMARLLGLERATVLYWQPETEELIGAASHPRNEEIRQFRAPVANLPLASQLISERQVMVCGDPVREGLLAPDLPGAPEFGATLAVPLVARDEVIGLLLGDCSGRPRSLSADEVDLAVIFAHQVAVWITNARLLLRERETRARAEAVERKFRALLESAPDGIVIVDAEGRIALVNSEAERLFGYRRDELLGKEIEILLPERLRAAHIGHRSDYLTAPRTRPMGAGLELFARRKEGEEFPVEISLSPLQIEEGILITSVIRDTTARKHAEVERERLLASEREKAEQLKLSIREAHHRIKNNLQAVSDLLYLEMAAGEGSSSSEVLRDSMNRIQAIASVHDLLSQEGDVRVVDARAVVESLVPRVLQSNGLVADGIDLSIDVPSIALSSKRATVLALIINELVGNAAKHAFNTVGRGLRRPALSVTLREENEELVLRVKDSGPGLQAEFDLATHSQVGLDVVRTLAERDLDGRLTLTSQDGVLAEVRFAW